MILFIVEKIFLLYTIMLFVRILASWVPEFNGQRWMQFIMFYTDPYLNFFRSFIPPLGMIDLSPIVAFISLNFIEQLVKRLIIQIS
jgi:YggT family protein